MSAPHPPATDPATGPDDVVSRIDIAVDQAREDVCACGCSTALSPDGHSFYFFTEGCQKSWRAQQNAIAAGDHELAERLRRQQRETPEQRESRHRAEVLANEAQRQEQAAVQLGVGAWLRANGVDPNDVLVGHPIVTTPTRVRVHEFIREPRGGIIVRPDDIPFAEREYRLMVPWPAGLRYEHHHHEPDQAARPVEEDQRVPPRIPLALAVRAMDHNERHDAVALEDDHPLAFRVRCWDCGRCGAPYGEAIREFGQAQPVRSFRVCEHCGAHSPGAPFEASVARVYERGVLVLYLAAGRHDARFDLAETEMGHYPTAAGIWDVLARLVQRKEQQERQGPNGATPALTVVDELAELPEPPTAAPGRVMWAPAGAPPDAVGWRDLGTTTGDGLVLGFDGATRDDIQVPALRTYHGGAVSVNFRLEASMERWRRAWEQIFEQVRRMGEQFRQMNNRLNPQRTELRQLSPMQRAIEAKKNRNTGPQPNQRAPKRIDPRRGR